jgi:hypothetical protein
MISVGSVSFQIECNDDMLGVLPTDAFLEAPHRTGPVVRREEAVGQLDLVVSIRAEVVVGGRRKGIAPAPRHIRARRLEGGTSVKRTRQEHRHQTCDRTNAQFISPRVISSGAAESLWLSPNGRTRLTGYELGGYAANCFFRRAFIVCLRIIPQQMDRIAWFFIVRLVSVSV